MPEITTPEHVIAVGIIVFAAVFVTMTVVLVWAVKYVINRSANSVQQKEFLEELKKIREDFKREMNTVITADKLKIEMLEQQSKVDKQLTDTRHQIRNEVEAIIARLQLDVANVRDTCTSIKTLVGLYLPQNTQTGKNYVGAGSSHDIA